MIIKVYLIRKRLDLNATALFDTETGTTIVKKGSRVSSTIQHSATFNQSNHIERKRQDTVTDLITNQDITFKSPSAAASFVTGNSSNGMKAWRLEDGQHLKTALEKE